ncbi:MAG: APC family permease [Thermotogae bacterium]|nr:APC family permease [Thermotogota bacterium]MCL5032673.1 APC family permease [Thermotogota bacterium]
MEKVSINEKETAEEIARESDKQLRKSLTLQDLFFLSLGGIVGSGWLLGGIAAAGVAGPASIISWVIGGGIVLFIALTFAEITSALPKSGSIVRYPHYAYGGYVGYIMGWAYLLGALTVPAVESEAILSYASTYVKGIFHTVGGVSVLTPLGIFYGVLMLIAFFFINWFGIRFLAKFNTVMTWIKFIIPVFTFAFLFFVLNKSNFVNHSSFFPTGVGSIFYAIPTAGIVFSFLGFRQALNFGGEAKNPQRDIPIATILSIVVAIFLYTMLEIAFVGALKWPAGVNWSTLTTSSLSSAPYFTELQDANIALFGAFAYFLLISAFVSPAGTGWIYSGSSARTLYGIAADGYYPVSLLKIHKKTKIPYIALITATLLGMIFFLPFPSWYLFIGFISSSMVLTYLMGPVMLMTFRKHAPNLYRPFKLPYASLIAPIGFVAGALIMYWSGISTLTMVFYTVLLGIPVFYLLYAPKKLDLPKKFAYIVGIVEFILTGFILVFNYLFVLYPASKESMSTKTDFFLIGLILMTIVWFAFTMLTASKVSEKYKILFTSSYWLFGMFFVTELVSYFGAFGMRTLIPFPWDTILMIGVYLVIYFFALKAGHKTEDLEAAIEEVNRSSNPAKT